MVEMLSERKTDSKENANRNKYVTKTLIIAYDQVREAESKTLLHKLEGTISKYGPIIEPKRRK